MSENAAKLTEKDIGDNTKEVLVALIKQSKPGKNIDDYVKSLGLAINHLVYASYEMNDNKVVM